MSDLASAQLLTASAAQLPVYTYFDPAFYALEQQLLFADAPQYYGHALMVPKTADGRVLFGVPWLGKVILGTTDTPRDDVTREPRPFAEEIEFILGEAGKYLARAPGLRDLRSIWVGLRPLVKPLGDDGEDTSSVGLVGIAESNRRIWVRRSEIANPRAGTFAIASDTDGPFRVTEATLDVTRQIWICKLNPDA